MVVIRIFDIHTGLCSLEDRSQLVKDYFLVSIGSSEKHFMIDLNELAHIQVLVEGESVFRHGGSVTLSVRVGA